jgi:hypothetical protein
MLSTARQVGHICTIVGGAGVGKSRLVREFVGRFGTDARVFRGRCLPYRDGKPTFRSWRLPASRPAANRLDDAVEDGARLPDLRTVTLCGVAPSSVSGRFHVP